MGPFRRPWFGRGLGLTGRIADLLGEVGDGGARLLFQVEHVRVNGRAIGLPSSVLIQPNGFQRKLLERKYILAVNVTANKLSRMGTVIHNIIVESVVLTVCYELRDLYTEGGKRTHYIKLIKNE